MKTRIVVHIALNAKNERVGCLVNVCGILIGFSGDHSFVGFKSQPVNHWLTIGNRSMKSLKKWKEKMKVVENSVRFQRVTLIGESK